MSYQFRPAVRQDTPLIIGIAGPTKSGKTYSAHRLARGLAGDKPIIMINAEGARGHQYADKFQYLACDIEAPFRPTKYTEALREAAALNPGCIIIDSGSHMHDGPGGILEWHEEELDRLAGDNWQKRNKMTFSAWIAPKAAENEFIYQMLATNCPIVLCLRAKEKLKIVPGRDPIDLGWQPIVGERVAFETMFTLMLTPGSKGVPDLSLSEMREPFDSIVPGNKVIDERLGEQLAAWARGGAAPATVDRETGEVIDDHPKLSDLLKERGLKATDLAPILGAAVTSDNIKGLIDEWLADQPDMSLVDLCQMAADVKREEETEPQAALI